MKAVSTEVGLGSYSSVIYEESDPTEYEKKCVELLKTYNLSQLNFVDVKVFISSSPCRLIVIPMQEFI